MTTIPDCNLFTTRRQLLTSAGTGVGAAALATLVDRSAPAATTADAIGGLRLIQLTGLEIEKLAKELRDIHEEIQEYERILGDQSVIMGRPNRACKHIEKAFHRTGEPPLNILGR